MKANKQTGVNARVGGGKPGPGRPKGSQNRLTVSAKQAFQDAFVELGGTKGLVAWAKADDDNLTDFYKLYGRLIPLEHVGTDGGEIKVAITDNERARYIAFWLTKGLRK